MTRYPPEPWDLHGHAYVGVSLVPRRRLPPPVSPATKPVTVFGRGVVGVAFFVYEVPSPVTCHELMATMLVRQGWRLRFSITHIWVDDADSRDGGRELWGIPKQMAEFEVAARHSYTARGIGSLAVRRSRPMPWRLSVAFRLAQHHGSSLLLTPVRGRFRPGKVRGRWTFAEDGPLAFVGTRRPLLTLAARPFHLVIGRPSGR